MDLYDFPNAIIVKIAAPMGEIREALCQNTNMDDASMSAFDWNDLRFFLAVARAGRLTVAARQLEADHTTVSRRISALEHALKTKLFERRPQGYSLTEEGERLLSKAETMESQALAVASEIGGSDLALSGHRAGRRTRRVRHLLPRAANSGRWPSGIPDLTLQLVALPPHLLAVEARGRYRHHAGTADRRRAWCRASSPITGSGSMRRRIISTVTARSATPSDLAGKTLVTYVPDLLYSPVLDYFSSFEKHTSRRYECASVVAQVEAVRAGAGLGVLHDYALRSFPELRVVLPEISFLRTYWLVTHSDDRALRRVEEVQSFTWRG